VNDQDITVNDIKTTVFKQFKRVIIFIFVFYLNFNNFTAV